MTDRSFFPAILFGLTTVLVIVFSSSLLLSLVLTFTSYTESSVNWAIISFAFIAMFLGGAMSGAKAKKKGWIVGGCTALFFSVLTFLIQYLGYESIFTSEQYMYHGGYLLAAMLGGVIGVNLTK
ncbi:TIGR04086 family membrane protein [bacterium LRH843]|nr:TIGR04086 family membrane protein [bacterium LRH843]